MRMLNVKNVDVTGNKRQEAFLKASPSYSNHFAMLGMAASTQFYEFYDEFVETKLYKRKAKQLLNRCYDWYTTYWKNTKEAHAERYQLYVDYANMCVKQIDHDIEIFFYTVKRALDAKRVKDSAIKARILIVAELIRVAATFHEDYWELASEHLDIPNLGKPYWYADHAPLLKLFLEFAICVCTTEESCVLDESEDCKTALRAILAKCENDDKLGFAAREAILQNAPYHPEYGDMVKAIDEERRMKMEQDGKKEDIVPTFSKEQIKEQLSQKYKVK